MLRLKSDLTVDEVALTASYPDYIVARMRLDGRTQRWLADQTGISRSRVSRLLHGDPRQRKALRIDEKRAILQALKVDDYVAVLAIELMSVGDDEEFEANVKMADLLSVVFKGLASEVASTIRTIEGFGVDDIRPEYGSFMRTTILRLIQTQFSNAARRKMLRLDELFGLDIWADR